MFGSVAPNGVGKTTAMRIILGVLEPDTSEVHWCGQRMTNKSRHRVGHIPQEHGQTFLPRCAADRSSESIADDRRTSGSGRPAHRAGGLWSMMAAPAAWLTELGFAGQAAAFKCDVSRRPGRSDGGCGSSLGRWSPLAGRREARLEQNCQFASR